jgi:hypothetical protein
MISWRRRWLDRHQFDVEHNQPCGRLAPSNQRLGTTPPFCRRSSAEARARLRHQTVHQNVDGLPRATVLSNARPSSARQCVDRRRQRGRLRSPALACSTFVASPTELLHLPVKTSGGRTALSAGRNGEPGLAEMAGRRRSATARAMGTQGWVGGDIAGWAGGCRRLQFGAAWHLHTVLPHVLRVQQ